MPDTNQPRCYSYLRFSRPEQKKGDTVRRQLEASARYAQEHGLQLDKNLTMMDKGLSAFRSKHIEKGALGVFLGAIEKGKVPRGSYLIVESLDRLSRDNVLVALPQFIDIITGGVVIVTLMDRQTYSEQSIKENPYQLMASIGVMARANEESEKKSERLTEAWKNKHANIATKPLTARTPSWLRLNKKTSQIEIIPERAEIVRQLFQMVIEGTGIHSLVVWLNKNQIETWGVGKAKAKTWSLSSTAKIIKGRAALGELQPVNREPISGYYPAVVNEETWYAAQTSLAGRKVGKGRTGALNNLFTYKARCGYCGAAMRFHQSKQGRLRYFICANAKYKRNCEHSAAIQYRELEEAFLAYCTELDVSRLFIGARGNEELIQAQQKAASITGRIAMLDKRINNLTEAIADAEDKESRKGLVEAHDKYFQERKGAEIERQEIEQTIDALTHADKQTADRLKSIQELQSKIAKAEGQERVELRKNLRYEISGILESMECFTEGLQNRWVQVTDNGLEIQEGQPQDLTSDYPEWMTDLWLQHIASNTGREHAAFLVKFKNGHCRLFRWSKQDAAFKQQIVDVEGIVEFTGQFSADKKPFGTGKGI